MSITTNKLGDDTNIHTGNDHAIGRFLDITDRRYAGTKNDLQGEGYLLEWSDHFGISTNLIGARLEDIHDGPDRLQYLVDKFIATADLSRDDEEEDAPLSRSMSPITGNEPVHPTGMYGQQESGGMTLRQLVFKDFMCAFITSEYGSNNTDGNMPSRIAARARIFTDAYFETLNKDMSLPSATEIIRLRNIMELSHRMCHEADLAISVHDIQKARKIISEMDEVLHDITI